MKTFIGVFVALVAIVATFLLVTSGACAPKAAPVEVGVNATNPGSTTNPTTTVAPHPVVTDKEFQDNQAKKAAEADKPLDKKIDTSVVGLYRMQLSPEQKKQIDDAIEQIKKDVAAKKQGAEAGLQMAMAARDLADKLIVNLKPNGRYTADLGNGDSGGTYRTGKGIVLLTPAIPPKDPNEPKDVEMAFDKTAKTLTADFQGQLMVFVRKD